MKRIILAASFVSAFSFAHADRVSTTTTTTTVDAYGQNCQGKGTICKVTTTTTTQQGMAVPSDVDINVPSGNEIAIFKLENMAQYNGKFDFPSKLRTADETGFSFDMEIPAQMAPYSESAHGFVLYYKKK